jgi:methyl-accepting chemotaxis protein
VVAEEIRNLADRSARATADIATIIRALQEVSQEAIASANDGSRIADESNQTAENGRGPQKDSWWRVGDWTLVSQIAKATDEQRVAGQSVVTGIAATADQSRQIATSTSEQAGAAASIVQATGEMRKVSQEVTKAVLEQSRAARDILKASQSASKLASQVRKASAEQSRSASEIAQAAESMRRGAVTTSRALAEQATATEQIVKSSDAMIRTVSTVNRSISEQATATEQITRASASMRQQADQAAKALKDQSRHARHVGRGREHREADQADYTCQSRTFPGVRHAVDRSRRRHGKLRSNARGVQQTRQNTADLLRHAEALNEIVDPRSARPHGANGRGTGANGH